MKVWKHAKSEKILLKQRFSLFCGTLFIQCFMRFRERLVAITIFNVLGNPVRLTLIHKIYSNIVVNLHFFVQISI